MLDAMEERGLEPNASLHHFTHPQWFEDLGAFEREANIPIFVEWCLRAVELFGRRIHFWATFNEPTVRAFLEGLRFALRVVCLPCARAACLSLTTLCLSFTRNSVPPPPPHTPSPTSNIKRQCAMFLGWITGMHPPGKILSCVTAGHVRSFFFTKLLSCAGVAG
jgi:hypothetical protein